MTGKSTLSKTVKVILDSNAFFVPFKFNIDIFSEMERLVKTSFTPILLIQVQRELERIVEEGSPKMKKMASQALKLSEKCELVEVDNREPPSTDDAVANAALKLNSAVFTNDRNLRKKLRDINVPVIYVRQKSHLEMDGRIRTSV